VLLSSPTTFPAATETNTIVRPCGPIALFIQSVGSPGSITGLRVSEVIGNGAGNFSSFDFATDSLLRAGATGPDITSINFNLTNAVDLQGQWGTASAAVSMEIVGLTARLDGLSETETGCALKCAPRPGKERKLSTTAMKARNSQNSGFPTPLRAPAASSWNGPSS